MHMYNLRFQNERENNVEKKMIQVLQINKTKNSEVTLSKINNKI